MSSTKQRKLTSFFAQKNTDKKQNDTMKLSKNQQLRQILNGMQYKQEQNKNPVPQKCNATQNNPYYAPILDQIGAQRKAERERSITENQKNNKKEPTINVLNGCKQNYFHGPTYGDHTDGKKSWKGYYEHRNKKMRTQSKNSQRSIYGDLSSNGIHFNKKRNRSSDAKEQELNETPTKRRKLDDNMDSNDDGACVTNIFNGVTVYFNGRTEDLSSFHLNKVLIMNGGNFSVHPNAKVTHIVTTNLSRSKIKKSINKMGKFRAHHVYYVNSKWITDSVKNGRLMNEDHYLVFKTNKHGNDIKNFFHSNRCV